MILLLVVISLHTFYVFGDVRVNIPQGTLVGTTITTRGGRGIFAFHGIPYAAPPVGDLRFKSPQSPPSWKVERLAHKEGNACIQQFVLIEKLRNTVTGSEDCLYLNVYTPELSQTQNLPVMFFIHGGGYGGGSGSKGEYGPELLLDRDVVLVTINYRLGPLGFLSTGDSVVPGNMGLKDQRAALQWVRANILHFGGNPDAVTIFGESAGGASVHFHMLSPQSKGLFHSAVSQSGTALCPWAFSTPTRHRQLATHLAHLLDCPKHPSTQLVECLKALPAEKIVGAMKEFIIWDMDPVVFFTPVVEPSDVEDAFLIADPWALSASVPWFLGFNRYEGALKGTSLTQGEVDAKFSSLNNNFEKLLPMSLLYQNTAEDPRKVTEEVRKFYFGDAEKITLEMTPKIVELYTDAWMSSGVLEAARRHSGPIFLYFFAYNSSTNFSLCNDYTDNPEYMGVCHFDELLYLFPMDGHAPRLGLEDPDYLMSKNMIELWTNFAKSRVPSLDGTSFWSSKEGSTRVYLSITNVSFDLDKDLITERDQFWQNLPYRQKPHIKGIADEL